ncbi:MAG: amino acid ABC transporter permease [Sphaerochaetaceae bacterium]|nr:amino acid ABC transporter permease [Sphaerochaetaceae bacterium]
MAQFLGQLLKASLVSLQVFFFTIILSLPLSLLVCSFRMSKNKVVSGITNIYIMIMRGTPLILQLLFVYFAPYYIFGTSFDRFTACIIAFVLNYAAYFAEIFRSGLQSLPIGQHEACLTLGIKPGTEYFYVKLPQVFRMVFPSLGNEVITLVKDTALAQTIGVMELFRTAQNAASRQFSTMPIFVAGLFYFVMNAVVSKLFEYGEKKLAYY